MTIPLFDDYDAAPTGIVKEIITRQTDAEVFFEWPAQIKNLYVMHTSKMPPITHVPIEFQRLVQNVAYYGHAITPRGNHVLKIGDWVVLPIADYQGWRGVILETDDQSIPGISDFPLFNVSAKLIPYTSTKANKDSIMGLELVDEKGYSRVRIGTVLKYSAEEDDDVEYQTPAHYELRMEYSYDDPDKVVTEPIKRVKPLFFDAG